MKPKWSSSYLKWSLLDLIHRRKASPIDDSCLMFNEKVLRQFHPSHPEINLMKKSVNWCTYWPRVNKDIELLVRGCFKCLNAARNSPRVKPMPWSPTKTPWSRVHVYFSDPINGIVYLILINSHSMWQELKSVQSINTAANITALDGSRFLRNSNVEQWNTVLLVSIQRILQTTN